MEQSDQLERRFATAEIRTKGRHSQGYVATFGAVADIGGGLTEEIRPGAFSDALRSNADILALLDHDFSAVLGRTKSGTLKLSEDQKGLAFSLDVPATRAGNDVLELAQRNDLGGMSFGFLVPKGGEIWEGTKRTLHKIDLREISIVSSHPAYPNTEIAVRHLHRIPDYDRRRRILELEELKKLWG